MAKTDGLIAASAASAGIGPFVLAGCNGRIMPSNRLV